MLDQLGVQCAHEVGAWRNGRRVPRGFRRAFGFSVAFGFVAAVVFGFGFASLRLHFTQVPRLVAAFALLVQLGHRRHAVKRNEHAVARPHDGNARVNAVANALQQLGLVCVLVSRRVLHLANHVVNHAVAVQVQIVNARQLGEPFDDARVFF